MMNIIISLTSIYQRQLSLQKTLQSCLYQELNDEYNISKIIINLSEEPYLLDKGFKDKIIIDKLNNFINDTKNKYSIEINWVKNTGSYRKLLPTLQTYWNYPNQIIITIDDDIILSKFFVYDLVKKYEENNNKYCVSYRGYTMDWDNYNNINNIKYYLIYNNPIPLTALHLDNFSTNGAGTIWTPSMFQHHKNSKELLFNYDIIFKICPTGDDIWYNFIRILNNVELYIYKHNKKIYKLMTNRDSLYYKINSISNNTKSTSDNTNLTNNNLNNNDIQLINVYNLIMKYK
jgi:hypothetical protein